MRKVSRGIFAPLLVLALILSLCLWNGHAISAHTRRWTEQADAVERLIRLSDWSGAEAALSESYRDWREKGTCLHIICRHDTVDGADDLYRRCLILVQSRNADACLPELSSLREQLDSLSDMERFSVGNLL